MSAVLQGAIEINEHEGRVILTVRPRGRPMVQTAHDPGQALEIANALAACSYNAKYGRPRPQLVGLADQIIEDKRIRLNSRLLIMVKSMTREGKSNQYIVSQCVDACLAEIT